MQIGGEYTLHGTNQPTFTSTKLQDNSDNNLTTLTFNNADVKDYVCKYYAGVNNNYGFVVCYTTEVSDDYNSFYSREKGNGLAPYLSVTYYEPANIENGTYFIRNKKSGHYLDVNNFGGAGTQLMQHSFNGGTNQQWVLQKQTADNTFKGYYRISPGHNTGLYLDVANANAANGTAIQVYTRTESNAQHWTLINNGDGSYRIMSKASSNRRCMTIKDSSTASGALVQQWDYTANTNTNDEWYLERAYNVKVYQSPRMPGQNEDGTQADDMKVNDYSKAQLTFANLNFNTYANTYDETNVIDGPAQVKNHMYLLADTFAVSDSSMNAVVRDMIKHFQDGSGTPYRNSILTQKAVSHQSTQNYINGTKNLIINWLKAHEGNPSNIMADSNLRTQLIQVGRPHYNTTADLTNGLTISINDTWGNYIELKNYKLSGNSFQGKLRFTIYDHFGLNEPDLTGSLLNMVKGCMRGFGSWFVLQHYTGCVGKYKPFITYIETEIDISETF